MRLLDVSAEPNKAVVPMETREGPIRIGEERRKGMAKERTWVLGRRLTRGVGLGLASLVLWGSVAPAWGAPTVAQMLSYRPRQEGVNFSTPTTEAASTCTVELVKGQRKGSGWLLKDSNKQPLRLFFDSNDDNKIDVWAYYKDGAEVYREIDSNF